ncbi:EI24 domain-containing protein [bacterium SCSIO 12741]|nr:EI24 domain-containing protein [bacterium SCSIO 12741]
MLELIRFRRFDTALKQHYRAWGFMRKNRLTWFFLFPLFFNALVFYGGVQLVSHWSDLAIESMRGWLDLQAQQSDWAEYIWTGLYVIVWIVIRILFFIFFAYVGGYVVLLLLSPILAWLSELTESKQRGTKTTFNAKLYLNNLFRGIAITLRCLILEALFTLIFFILGLIPLIGFAAPAGLFGVTAYYYGFSLMDYTLERRGYTMSQSIRFMRYYRGSVIGIGVPFSVVLIIPILGPFISGFVAIWGSVAATLETLEILDSEAFEKNFKG